VRPPGGIPEGQRIFELVNSKFKALDDLVYVLKKRILSLETNEELADAVKQFGMWVSCWRTTKGCAQRTRNSGRASSVFLRIHCCVGGS
jgi:hypothetical protein